MRTNVNLHDRTLFPSARLAVLTGLAALSGLAACADSLRIDTSTTGTGASHPSSSSSGGGGGSGGGSGCVSNAECKYPTPVCDRETLACVECLVISDCEGKPGTVCSLGACTCPKATETFCAADGAQNNRCTDTMASSVDCGTCGHACFGACATGKCADKWEPTRLSGAPEARNRHVAVWTGSQMIVWGGFGNGNAPLATGGMYDPAAGTWTATSLANAPSARGDATAIWDDTHKQMIVWGGFGNGALNTGAVFDPAKNAWKAIASAAGSNVPSPRRFHTAVWTGTQMIVWGGTAGGPHFDDGGIYDAMADTWTAIPGGAGPSARGEHAAVWDDGVHQMVMYGGFGYDPLSMTEDNYLGTGAIYGPSLQMWTGIPPGGSAPSARARQTAVWTGDAMLIWGGYDGASFLNDGGRFAAGIWFTINDPLPEPREGHTAVWIDSVKQMIIFGGDNASGQLNTGYSLDSQLKWTALPTAPAARTHHTAVVNGSSMIIWGGSTPSGLTNTGAVFDAKP